MLALDTVIEFILATNPLELVKFVTSNRVVVIFVDRIKVLNKLDVVICDSDKLVETMSFVTYKLEVDKLVVRRLVVVLFVERVLVFVIFVRREFAMTTLDEVIFTFSKFVAVAVV